MPSPEQAPALTQPNIVEKKRKARERFDTIPTHIRGVSLRFEPDIKPDIPKRAIEIFLSLAREFATRYFQIKDLESQQTEPGKEIKTLAAISEGLRGILSEEDDFILTVIPKDSVSWNQQLLQEGLGIAYSTVAREDLAVTISVPAGFMTKKGPASEELLKQVVAGALTKLGFAEDDLTKIMESKINLRIDEKILNGMVVSGKVSLPEGAKTTERTWSITVNPLRKSPKN